MGSFSTDHEKAWDTSQRESLDGSAPHTRSRSTIPIPTWGLEEETEFDQNHALGFDDDTGSIDVWYSNFLKDFLRDDNVYTSKFIRDPRVPTVIIYSEDKNEKWIVNSKYLSELSETLAGVFAFSPGIGHEDPCRTIPGIRRLLKRNAFQLDDVTTDEFDIFLDALRESSLERFSYEDLKIILGLASDWGLNELRYLSKVRLERLYLTPLDKVSLGRRCKFTEWVREAYLYLALRTAPLSDADAWVLGTRATSIICLARNEVSIHRQQVLESEEFLGLGSGCTRKSCQKTLTEAWFWVRGGRLEDDTEATIISQILVEAAEEGNDLCFVCRKEIGVKDWLRGMNEVYEVAKAVLTHVLGTEDLRWLKPALSPDFAD